MEDNELFKLCSPALIRRETLLLFLNMVIDGLKYIGVDIGKKLANALFGQKNQHTALFPKLIREMPLFCNSIIRKSRFMKKSIIGLLSYIQPFTTLA